MILKPKTILITTITMIFLIVLFLFYFVLRNTKKEISDQAPYAEILNKNILTINDALYIKNSTLAFTKEYPYEIQDFETIDTSSIEFIQIPKGSILRFQKAFQINKAVSGSKYALLLGELILKDTDVKIPVLYHWGTFKSICIETPCNFWEHRKAPWQKTIDTIKYFN